MKTMVAAGSWPDDWDEADVEYEEARERMLVDGEEPLTYHRHGGERCAWCDRPIETCLEDPCEHYQEEG